MTMDDDRGVEPDPLHDLKNQLFVVVSYCKILLSEMPATDPKYRDIMEIDKATRAAIALLPELAKRMK
jgi:hypothetical protein